MENLIPIDQDSLKTIQLDILKFFIKKCEDNNIKYFLAYGSLLGAIRHHGFIPWDDDIDVMIYRDDVSKLAKVFDDDRFKIINSSINKRYFSPLIKVYDSHTLLIQNYGQNEGINLGVYIDVFVLERVPLDDKKRKSFYKKAADYRLFWSLSCSKFNSKSKNFIKWIVKRIVSIPFKIIGFHFFASKYEKFASSYSGDFLYGIVIYSEGYDKEYAFTKEDLLPLNVKFEDLFVSIPSSFDSALKKCYGNYMEIPPIEERKKHLFEAYYLK